MGAVAEFCASFVFDNSTFADWKAGTVPDFDGYARWCAEWARHPGLDWCLIPDLIDGSESDNDLLIREWPDELRHKGVPVWHLHESLERLDGLVSAWTVVALGSSGTWRTPGTDGWWHRMAEAMAVACDFGATRGGDRRTHRGTQLGGDLDWHANAGWAFCVKVTHELRIHGRCPVNDALDTYDVVVEAERIVKVEDILAATASLPPGLFQEQITELLASTLGCRVTTVGYHSGVKTTCCA